MRNETEDGRRRRRRRRRRRKSSLHLSKYPARVKQVSGVKM